MNIPEASSLIGVISKIDVLVFKHVDDPIRPTVILEQSFVRPQVCSHLVVWRAIVLTGACSSGAHVGIENHITHQVVPDCLFDQAGSQHAVLVIDLFEVHLAN